jgi:hypothetical protein
MLCGICEGKGHTTQEQVTALAVEMIKIASDLGEPEDPFAAWESVSMLQSQNDQLRKALKPFADKADIIAKDHPGWNDDRFTWGAEPLLFKMKVLRDARAALASHPCTSTPVVSQNAPDLEDKEADGRALERMIDIAEMRLMAIHKALEPKAFGITGIESPEDALEYMTGVLRAALIPSEQKGDADGETDAL